MLQLTDYHKSYDSREGRQNLKLISLAFDIIRRIIQSITQLDSIRIFYSCVIQMPG